MVQISFANISIGGYAQASITDLHNAHQKSKIHSGTILESTALFLGGKNIFFHPRATSLTSWISPFRARNSKP